MTMTQTLASGAPVDEFPVSPSGAAFRYALVRGEMATFADTLPDLIGALLPGYTALSDDDAQIARWQCAAATATQVQQMMAAALDLDPSAESEDTLTAIFADRAMPVPADAIGDRWDHRVPLVLLATDYAPFTAEPRPQGNVQFIDSGTERAFLSSLAGLGVLAFYAHDDVEG